MVFGKWTADEDARLIALLAAGQTVKEASAELGRTPQVVHSHMNYRGITKRSVVSKVKKARKELSDEKRDMDLGATEEELAKYLPKEVE